MSRIVDTDSKRATTRKLGPSSRSDNKPKNVANNTVSVSFRKTRPSKASVRKAVILKNSRLSKTPVPAFDAADQNYIDAIGNPFGSEGETHFTEYENLRVPDNQNPRTGIVTIHLMGTVQCNTGDDHYFYLTKPQTNQPVVLYDANGPAAGNYPTANTVLDQSAIQTWIAANVKSFRYVAAGLRVNISSSVDTSGGALRGGLDSTNPYYTGPAYSSFATLADELEIEQYAVSRGMTVRWYPQVAGDFDFEAPAVNSIANTSANCAYWNENGSPRIYVSSATTGTTLMVEAVVYLEVQPMNMAGYVWGLARSPCSQYWDTIVRIIRDPHLFPTVTEGHSFKSFFSAVGKYSKNALEWLIQNGPKMLQIGSMIGSLM